MINLKNINILKVKDEPDNKRFRCVKCGRLRRFQSCISFEDFRSHLENQERRYYFCPVCTAELEVVFDILFKGLKMEEKL